MVVNKYESIIIFEPDIDRPSAKIKLYEDFISSFSDIAKTTLFTDYIGEKSLVYEIKGKKRGIYVKFTWKGLRENIIILESQLKADDNVLKFLNLKLDSEDIEFQTPDISEQKDDDDLDLFDLIYG